MGAKERLFSCSGLWFVLLLARPSVRPPARPLTLSNIGRPFIHLHVCKPWRFFDPGAKFLFFVFITHADSNMPQAKIFPRRFS
jgi:hypothetical protein